MSCRTMPCSRLLAALAATVAVIGAAISISCSPARAADYVIHVSIDGLGGPLLQEIIDAGDAPTLARLEREGAWTANARTDYTYTVTLPNHTSMLTGRPVDQPEGMSDTVQHGYALNSLPEPNTTLHNTGNPNVDYIAGTFDVVHDAGLSTGLYASKDKFMVFDRSWDASHGAPNDHGRDKTDVGFIYQDPSPAYSVTMNQRLVDDLAANHFNYTFVHYADPDAAGHAHDWGSPEWRQAVSTVDSQLADVVKLVETDPVLRGHTAIVVTADHGGKGDGHGENSNPANYTVPVIVWGAGVGQGDLYAMNSDVRADPGTSRPDYNAPAQPIRNVGTGNLALSLLGLGAIPGSLANAEQDLRVTSVGTLVGDYNRNGVVDAADYTVWHDTQGSTTDLRADGNGDGVVDEADHEAWKKNYGHRAVSE